jgi:methylenetetrahydrofolate reductase (NADPH)
MLEIWRGGECQKNRSPQVSFEFFPPKTDALSTSLWSAFQELCPFKPVFVSVTYGAGGATRNRTHEIVAHIRRETDVVPAAHLTCVGSTRKDIREIAQKYSDAGVSHIVALRGDPALGDLQFKPHQGGYSGSVDLIKGLREIDDFEITAAAYPEQHPESRGIQPDMDYLKRKCDAGAVRFITQFFFDNDCFFRFCDSARGSGITVPIVPGILPITNFKQIARFSEKCGAIIPASIVKVFETASDEPGEAQKIALDIAGEQCLKLLSSGVGQLHFYTLNRADLVSEICRVLGIGVWSAAEPILVVPS